jgi:hypothetical protein
MSKTIDFKPLPKAAEAWIQTPKVEEVVSEPAARPKRLTVEISQELHRRVKVACAQEGKLIADVVRDLLENAYPAA